MLTLPYAQLTIKGTGIELGQDFGSRLGEIEMIDTRNYVLDEFMKRIFGTITGTIGTEEE